jgi:hypothetical protein
MINKDKQKQKALKMLLELSNHIKKDSFEVQNSDFWQNSEDDTIYFRVSVKNVEDLQEKEGKS